MEPDEAEAAVELQRNREVSHDLLAERAKWLRLEILRVIQHAGLGHYSSTLSCAEVLSVLYYRTMRLRPKDPTWENRDRFLLGKGHVAVGLWPILADLGYFPESWLNDFGKLGAPLTDHPDMRTSPEIDGHDVAAVTDAFDSLPVAGSDQPTCGVARTLKGKGVSFMEAKPRDWHLGILGPEDYERAKAEIMGVAV